MPNYIIVLFCLCSSLDLVYSGVDREHKNGLEKRIRDKRGYGARYDGYYHNEDEDLYNNYNRDKYEGSSYKRSSNYNQYYEQDMREKYSQNPFLDHVFTDDTNGQNQYHNKHNTNGYLNRPKQTHNSYVSHHGYGQNQYETEDTSNKEKSSEHNDLSALKPILNITKTDTIDLSENIFFNGIYRRLINQALSTTSKPNNVNVFNPTTAPNDIKTDIFKPTPVSNDNLFEEVKSSPASNINITEVFELTTESNDNIENSIKSTTEINYNIIHGYESTTVSNSNIIDAVKSTAVPNNIITEASKSTTVKNDNETEPEFDIDIRFNKPNKDDYDIIENNIFILKSSTAPTVTSRTNIGKIDQFENTTKAVKATNKNTNKRNNNSSNGQNDFSLKPAVSFEEGTFLIYNTLNKDKVERTTLPTLQPVAFRANIPVFAATCTPRSGGHGSCISILKCDKYLELLRTAKSNPSARQELRDAQCGNEGKTPKVCCPTTQNDGDPGGFVREPLPRPIMQLPDSPQCGGANFKFSRVVGGIPASLGELPWMALLGYHGRRSSQPRWLCGGSLITSRHVLTAAHCVHSYENDLFQVRLGELDLSTETEGASPIDVPIRRQHKHEDYDTVTHKNDIAVLELENDVQFTDYIKPICMPKDSDLRSKTFERYRPIVAGWGDTRFLGPSSPHLLLIQLPVSTKASCKSAYEPFKSQITIDDTVLCAGLPQGGKDACQGDSGGPLVQPILKNGATIWYQIGVVSFGKKCAEPNMPGVYTRVTEFVPWIEEKIRA